MRVSIVSSFANVGGAGRAAYRLHKGLESVGVETRMLVQSTNLLEGNVDAPESSLLKLYDKVGARVDGFPTRLFRRRDGRLFRLKWVPGLGVSRLSRQSPDIVNLHSFRGGFLRLEAIRRIKKPIVWTMHDMWCLTGGCHYVGKCLGYQEKCGTCPALGSRRDSDLSRWVWRRKKEVYEAQDLAFVAPSNWLAESSRRSSLLGQHRVEVIPYGVDLERFSPIPKQQAREALALDPQVPVVVFGAESATTDPRKGFRHIEPALHHLKAGFSGKQLLLLVFGATQLEAESRIPFRVHCLGTLRSDQELQMAYSAGDVFLCPSEEDNLPNTIIEAMACGTPTVAFASGGIPDLIEHRVTGYLAEPFDPRDLARGIELVISSVPYSFRSRELAVGSFGLELQGRRYKHLFETLIARSIASSENRRARTAKG